MSIKKEVGQATWDSWPIGARMAIELLEGQLQQARQDATDAARYAAIEQRWADKNEADRGPWHDER